MGVLDTDYQEDPVTQREAVIRGRLLGGSSFPLTAARSATITVQSSLPQHSASHFRAILHAGETVSLPEQVFDFHPTEGGGYYQSRPSSHWPVVRLDVALPGNVEVHYAAEGADTVLAGLLRTRLLYALNTESKCDLVDQDGNSILEIATAKMAAQEVENQISLARLYRKLRFIEERFRTTFVLPEQFTARDVRDIEILFRGITEGDFSSRTDEITFLNYSPSSAELSAPPFSRPGQLAQTTSGPYFILLGKKLETGPHTVILERAVVANPSQLTNRSMIKSRDAGLRFIVLDSQIRYVFERYGLRSTNELRKRLEEFRDRLLQDEPEDLVRLLTEPLTAGVSPAQAIQIANGWLQFYDFPDRYCSQEPVLEDGQWRVPVWITYPDRQGGWIQDLFIDLTTGVVNTPVSPEEFRRIGKSVAARLSRAS